MLGAAINAWVDPELPGTHQASHDLLDSEEGSVRVAVRVEPLPDGRWRYRYAVMNFDFARAVIDPAHASEPDLKLLSNAGFAGIEIPFPVDITADELSFADADRDPGNAWSGHVANDKLSWQAPVDGGISSNTLDWGTLYSFSFVASTPPGPADVSLRVATTQAGLPATYTVQSLAPRADLIFADGYEPQP